MKNALLVLAICLTAFLAACAKEAESSNKTSNPDCKVEKLFTTDEGYTVYRFEDYGSSHYFVVPQGTAIKSTGGKNSKSENIETK